MLGVQHAMLTFLTITAQGVNLSDDAKSHLHHNDTISGKDAASETQYMRHIYVPQTEDTPALNSRHRLRRSVHVNLERRLGSIVNLERRLGSIVAASDAGFSMGAVIGALVILLCLLVTFGFICLFVTRGFSLAETHGKGSSSDDISGVGQRGARVSMPSVFPPTAGRGGQLRGDLRNFMFTRFPNRSGDFVPKSLYESKPLPLCPESVLIVESWYAVGFDRIDLGAGAIPIYGRGQQMLFTARINRNAPRTVTLKHGDDSGPLLGSITSVKGSYVIQDRHNRPYGLLNSDGYLAYSLTCGGVEVLNMSIDSQTGRALLVNPYDGTDLASAAKIHDTSDLPAPEDHLGIAVVAGMDPVLAILCVMGPAAS